MKPADQHPVHLTYCLNVHPGESWAENRAVLDGPVLDIRNRVAPGKLFGLGLRLARQAADDLQDPAVRGELKDFLAREDLYVFTVNGFPYGGFHGKTVKEAVYRPDWRERERLDYTNRLVDLLADLLPEGVRGSISTVPGSYRAWCTSDDDRRAIADNLVACACHCAEVASRTGREIHVGLEPEPDCLLETTDDVIAFFENDLRPAAGAARAEVDRHIGICFDTCHLAVQFEDLAVSLRHLHEAGIRLSKVQVSAALKAVPSDAVRQRLAAFADSIYLHQVKQCTANGPASLGDLPDALRTPPGDEAPWHVHCHVPLYFEGDAELQTTADDLSPEVFSTAIACGAEHFEIETYTFDVLPESVRETSLTESVAHEFEWVLARFPG